MKRLVLVALVAVVACGGSAPSPSTRPVSTPTEASAEPAPTPPPTTLPPPSTQPSTPTLPTPSTPTSTSTSIPADAPDAAPSFDMTVVFDVNKQHKDTLRAACWDHSKSSEKAYLGKATIRLSPAGKVLSSKTEGTDEAASACVDKQIKKWKFPPPSGTATIVLPVHLHRD